MAPSHVCSLGLAKYRDNCGADGMLRAGSQPALDGCCASAGRRVTNPPQVANLSSCSKCGSSVPALSIPNEPKGGPSIERIWLLIPVKSIIFIAVILSRTDQSKPIEPKRAERIASTGNVAQDQLMAHSEEEQASLLGRLFRKDVSAI